MSARKVTVLGATGSVGRATLDLVMRAPGGAFEVIALTANSNVEGLAQLAVQTGARFCAVADPGAGVALKAALEGRDVACGAGPEAVLEAARMNADWVMAAIVGVAGLLPTVEAVRRGATVAFANKEALVCAGELLIQAAQESGTQLLPVDSEHNAIFQTFDDSQRARIRRIILTASGGSLRTASLEVMGQDSVAQAVAHPVWSMGAKISVDRATMMNKGLEIIEACHLFALPQSDVDILVHPESVVHGLVEYTDGGLLAQLGAPDMRTPIAHVLAWPDRIDTPVERLDLTKLGKLTFEAPDPVRFPALDLARAAFEAGKGAPAIFNAANEVAVEAFLNGQIGFLDITTCVAESLERGIVTGIAVEQPADFDAVLEVDGEGRRLARHIIAERAH